MINVVQCLHSDPIIKKPHPFIFIHSWILSNRHNLKAKPQEQYKFFYHLVNKTKLAECSTTISIIRPSCNNLDATPHMVVSVYYIALNEPLFTIFIRVIS